MDGGLRIFRIFGIDIKIHFTWLFIFVLLAWGLREGFFPQQFPGFSAPQYWFMGIVAALLLFVSVLLHELSHSLVAQAQKIKVESITLFFFGGVAGITREDMEPKSEFLMAIAGPLFSLALSGVFYAIYKLTTDGLWHPIVYYLAFINLVLALFNVVPAFPLDGGRAFRALLHAHYKDLRKATRIAATAGRVFAGYLVIEGIMNFFGIVLLVPGGLWFILLGGFLYFLAGMSYEQVIVKQILSKIPLSSLPKKSIPTVPADLKFSQFARRYAPLNEDVFLIRGKSFVGLLDVHDLRISPEEQQKLSVKDLAMPLQNIRSLAENDNAYQALQQMQQLRLEVLPVKKGKHITGFLTKEAIIRRLLWESRFGAQGRVTKVVKRLRRKRR